MTLRRARGITAAVLALAAAGGTPPLTRAQPPTDPDVRFNQKPATPADESISPPALDMPASSPAVAAPRGRPTPLAYQDSRPFTAPMVPGQPVHPPGARYHWPGGIFYGRGLHKHRPPVSARYFDFQRIAPQTQWWP